MHEHASARQALEGMIRRGDLEGLLRSAEALHGHLCPMLALGVKAAQFALAELAGESHRLPEVAAVVEGLNCLVDGVQLVTGCTLGNGALIVKDLGKTAVTVARRTDGHALRLAVLPDFRERLWARYPAAGPLFEKVMVQKADTDEDRHRFQHLWEAVARRELGVPLNEQFQVQRLRLTLPPARRSLEVTACGACGEGVAASRARIQGGRTLCPACAGEEYFFLDSRGLSRGQAGEPGF